MKISVRSVLAFSRAIGSRDLPLDLPAGSTVEQALSELTLQCGEPLSRMLWGKTGKLLPHIRLLVNGQDVGFLSGLATPLHEDDDLTLIPPAGGG